MIKGCDSIIAYVLDKEKKRKKMLDEIKFIWDIPKVFTDDLPCLSPKRQVELDHVPVSTPIARDHYHSAPIEMHELMSQLQIITRERFYLSNFFIVGASCYSLKRKMDRCEWVSTIVSPIRSQSRTHIILETNPQNLYKNQQIPYVLIAKKVEYYGSNN